MKSTAVNRAATRTIAALLLALSIGCREEPVVDRGGKSLDVPVPSSGVAAVVKGPEKDIFEFPRRAKRDPSRIAIGRGPHGEFLVDGAGRAVYAFSRDQRGQTACLTNCVAVWPPVIVDELPRADGAGVDAALLSTIARPDGTKQLTYAGRPLYYAEADLEPGQTWGHYAMSFGGHFALVSPAGEPLPAPRP